MGVPKSKEEMVACTYSYYAAAFRGTHSPYPGFGSCTIYLCNFLKINFKMSKVQKISVPKKKKRLPLPIKPPKIEKNKKAYDRKKEKDKLRKKSDK